MGLSDGDGSSQFRQNVVVMRHGDRLDNVAPLWSASAPRPWDPPLADDGHLRAYATGDKINKHLSFPIHRVFVSPFLRCLQTASGVASALCADDPIDPSKIKVSIEYGLCEMMNSLAIRPNVAPKDGIFSFDISQCESVLPAGTIDNTTEMVYKELPGWQETREGARDRYMQVITSLADKYPSENLLLVTHGEGVGTTIARCFEDVEVAEVEYCAYSVLQRSVVFEESKSFTAGQFVGSVKDLAGIQLMQVQET
ncbi:hypothetical protein SASPL_106118 [Salvia splendens]|uniref:Phosphoglycerate mutase n=1 Tax=Salvia splendens TaxID=180675 RepID=A0A8X8YL80_SALSN|nr:uncharacterized protein LOC121769036 [Salvia splendens]KAG6434481.1 hypothetical protein SASPL_106118 [Salvia splendens]